jgi:hypothetical protein
LKTIITTENTELWQSFAKAVQSNVVIADVYSDNLVEGSADILLCTQAVTELNVLEADIKNHQLETVLVFYQQCEYAIVTAISHGKSLEQAALDWEHKMRSLLQFHKQNRRSIKLINLEQALANPKRLSQQLELLPVNLKVECKAETHSSMQLLLACQYVRQEVGLNELNTLLNASSLPLTDSVEIALDNQFLLAELDNKENELLHLQLTKVQEELEIYYLKNKSIEKLLATVKEEKQALSKDNQSLLAELDKHENELLLLQLTQLQEELEFYYLNSKSIEKLLVTVKEEKQALSKDKANLENKLNVLSIAEKSKSKLYSQTLQQVKTKEFELATVKEENQALSKGKANLESKLNVLSIAEKSKSNLYSKTLQQIKIKRLELSKLKKQNEKAKIEIEILKHRLQQSTSENEVIKSSALWKSAEKVRKLARVVNKFDKKGEELQKEVALLLTSDFFDPDWYLSSYLDVAASNTNPAEHYLKFGAKEGRLPSPRFDGNWYLQRYPDVVIGDINPLIHFIKFGISERRNASPNMLTNQGINKGSQK